MDGYTPIPHDVIKAELEKNLPKIEFEVRDDVTIVHLAGKIFGFEDDAFKCEIDKLLSSRPLPNKLIIDFDPTTFIDTMAIGCLIGAWQGLQPNNGQIIFVHPTESIMDELKMMGLVGESDKTNKVPLFTIASSIEEAMKI